MLAPTALRVTDSPIQTEFGLAVAVIVGFARRLTWIVFIPSQPSASVPVTVYVAVAEGTKAVPFTIPASPALLDQL